MWLSTTKIARIFVLILVFTPVSKFLMKTSKFGNFLVQY